MADDLVVTLSADTMDFVRQMRGAANDMKGMGAAAQQTNSLLSRMNWGMMAGGLATGLQDAASVLSNNGTFRMALNAAGNNLIQVAAMAHPIAGALAAAGIAAVQLAPLLSLAAGKAKWLREEAEAGAKALISAIGSSVSNPDKTKADIQQEIDAEEKKQTAIRDLRNKNAAEIQRIDEQMSALGAAKTLTPYEQALLDVMRAQNIEYNKALALGSQRMNQLHQQQQLADAAGGRTTEEIERMEIEAEAIWESVKREENRALEEMGLRKSKEEAEADAIHAKARQDVERWKADLDERHRADAQLVRDSILNPRELLAKEALRLGSLPLTDEERAKALMKQAASAFNGGPQLSAGLVKGTIEEESFRNRKEAENRMLQNLRQMVDKIIRELKPKEPPPEIVVGGGH